VNPEPPSATRPSGPVAQFGAAWTCLTRLPWPLAVAAGPGAIGRAAWAFPIIGGLLGMLGGGAYWLAFKAGLPALVAAALALGVMIAATGALHEDGLADTADGLGGGRDRAHALAIMKESGIGAYGATALGLALILRAGALAALAPAAGLLALVAAAAFARAAATVPMALLAPARADGYGAAAGRAPLPAMIAALALALAIAAGAVALGAAPILSALIGAALAFVAAGALMALAWRKLGGVTGDVLGAVAVASETAVLAGFALRLPA
jgi:adenosylcobinamide-GDP ribazoletransferase